MADTRASTRKELIELALREITAWVDDKRYSNQRVRNFAAAESIAEDILNRWTLRRKEKRQDRPRR